jgi:hypothetical protein
MPLAIREAGFKPEKMNVVALGSFDGSGKSFTPLGWKEPLRLESALSTPPRNQVKIESAVVGWSDDDATMDSLRLADLKVQ